MADVLIVVPKKGVREKAAAERPKRIPAFPKTIKKSDPFYRTFRLHGLTVSEAVLDIHLIRRALWTNPL